MRSVIIAVGRAKAGPEKALFEHFRGRLKQPFSLELKEVEEKRPLQGPELKSSEAALLLAAMPKDALIIALDERGKSLTSPQFSKQIGNWRDAGERELAFLIGGADGLDESIREQARLTLSFGNQTWPHMLVRGLLAEQLYRAQCILGGHPYHRQ
ncbi:MAG: 23S rRNA (pseudouridine(1915)-N(3))-methyltransferase RlmH [Rhodospirillales bacterium]|nr:23S rRNA (pseudouridine(1915)-N(3))-methyltransferase RlmH [Rhodospirillales bacterium]